MNFISPDEFFKLTPDKQRDYLQRVQNIKYGLYWNERRHAEAVVTQCETLMPVLDEVEDKRIFFTPPAADLFDTPERPQPTHLLIEGDNYHALSVLNYTHRGKVDLIYIDPPYNTGNRDFRYNDNFVDKEDGDRHTKWLSFMHRRLQLAKDLLKESGVIFISIDDNEVAQLKLLCDKVLGEGNFVANVIWQKSKKGDSKMISVVHEYILVYTRSKSEALANGVWRQKKPGVEEVLEFYQSLIRKFGKNHDMIQKEIRDWYRKLPKEDNRKKHKHYNCSDERGLYFPDNFAGPDDGRKSRPRYEIYHPITGLPCKKPSTGWRWDETKTKSALAEVPPRVHFGPDENTIPNRKSYLFEIDTEPFSSLFYQDGRKGTLDLENIVGPGKMPFPKNVEVIENIVRLLTASSGNHIILDFFAGSGTTGHAVLELNKEDGGRRQFILVTNNEVTDKTRHQLRAEGKNTEEIEEQGICRAVTYPRLQKVIEGYTNPKGEKVPGTGGKLRYFRTGFTPDAAEPGGATALAVSPASANPDQAAYNLRDKCAEMICVRENVFDRQAKTEGWELYRDFNRLLALLYDDAPENVTALRQRMAAEPATEQILYVFTLGTEISPDLAASFEGVRLESIPARIIDLYKRHLQQTARKTRLQQTKIEVAQPGEDILPDNENNTPAT
jgi:DNA modification methylase